MTRWVVVGGAVFVLVGCYTRRHIIVPPSEHARLCVETASTQRQVCILQQRGFINCDEEQDRALLRCEGAYEFDPHGDGGVLPAPVETYQLPGYRP